MLEKLQKHWKVNGLSLILIIATFALGGSFCGWAGRKLLLLMNIEKGVVWVLLYIILITLLWPVSVLIVSVPLGQFAFFKRYIARIGNKFSGKKSPAITNIAIFASGAGSNAKKIIEYFNQPGKKEIVKICLVVSNKQEAAVLNIAKENNIPTLIIEKERFFNGDAYLPELTERNINMIVLAGFLWKLPGRLINSYSRKTINIHPALLPAYGGKGMYGMHVHEAVITNKEKETGISIHFVDELYDHGEIIFQAKYLLQESDTAETIAENVHELEHRHYAPIIELLIKKQNMS